MINWERATFPKYVPHEIKGCPPPAEIGTCWRVIDVKEYEVYSFFNPIKIIIKYLV